MGTKNSISDPTSNMNPKYKALIRSDLHQGMFNKIGNLDFYQNVITSSDQDLITHHFDEDSLTIFGVKCKLERLGRCKHAKSGTFNS